MYFSRICQWAVVGLLVHGLIACTSTPLRVEQSVTVVPTIKLAETSTPSQPKEPTPVKLQIAAVGDVMLGTDYPEDYLPEKDGADLLVAVTPWLRDADITFGNFEGTFLDGGKPIKQCQSKHCYLFRTPTRYVQRLVEAGFNVMSLANNHARDFGETGRSSSMQVLTDNGIRHSGLEGDVAEWVVKGKKLALIAYAPFAGAHDPRDTETAKATIAALAQRNDVVIVSMHMGAEGADVTHLTFEREIFHGEDRGDSVAFAHAAIDAGADLVIGHGPHVPRALELYHDRLIAYSLGNFCTYQGINVAGITGLAPILKVELDDQGRFLQGKIESAVQQRPVGPIPDSSHKAARLMAKLTAEDFPETGLKFLPDGTLQKQPADDKSSPGR